MRRTTGRASANRAGLALKHSSIGTIARVTFATTLSFLLLTGCAAVGHWHTSDARLERNFFQHEAEFNALLADVQSDTAMEMVGVGVIRYAGRTMEKLKDPIEVEHVGLPKEKWMRYQRSLRALGIVQILKGEGGVSFKVDQNSISNGDSDKGYEYDLAPPEHQKTSLDAYRISANDRD